MAHEHHAEVLARYQNLEIRLGNAMQPQFEPHYLGLAFPFTLPCAVGGYDVPGRDIRWRRPELRQIETNEKGSRLRGIPLRNAYFAKQ